MSKEIIINSTAQETRVALLENSEVTELYMERKKDKGIIGNIYKGRVVKILPGMQAAFIDIGLEKAGFLYVTDVFERTEEYKELINGAGVEIEDIGFSTAEDNKGKKTKETYSSLIEDVLREGQEILVQISKEPLSTKGARVTSYITLPGRHLVFMPTIEHVGISRRIEDGAERNRLKKLIQNLKAPGTGFIVRTVSKGKSEEEFKADMDFLSKLWDKIQKKGDKVSAPALVHGDLDLTLKTIRDLFTTDINRLVIDSKEDYENVVEFVNTFLPHLVSHIELYEQREPIFDAYDIEMEISKALAKRVWLKSGGYIIIDQTEALVSIDVNTGRYVGKRKLEDTILKTNLEAVREIVYQLRLRNIGGIIIIDFIDMENEKNKEKTYHALVEALKKDRARTNILQISEFGLVEMTRQRVKESLGRMLCQSCPYCDGRGYVKSAVTVCYEIFREIIRLGNSFREKSLLIIVHPSVADLLYDEERQGIEDLESKFNKKIIIKGDNNFHQEQFEVISL